MPPPAAIARRLPLVATWVLIAAAMLAPAWYWRGGLIEIEALQFVRQYLDDRRGVIEKVFDPNGNDLGTYQARELSYFFDYLDAQIFEQLLVQGRVFFVPASVFLASLLTVAAFVLAHREASRRLGLGAALLLLVYLSNYVYLVTMGMHYRSTKPLLAPVVMGTAFYLVTLVTARRGTAASAPGRLAPMLVFCLLSVMSLLDRQGFFYAVVGTGVLLFSALFAGGSRKVVIAAVAAIAVMVVYNLIVAPAIIQRASGYLPSFEYQRLPFSQLFAEPAIWWRGTELLLLAGQVLAGSLPRLGFVVLIGAMVFAATRSARARQVGDIAAAGGSPMTRGWTPMKVAVLFALVAAALIVMSAAMVARHPPIYDFVDHRLWYYPLPFQALLIGLTSALLMRLSPEWSRRRVAIVNVLLAAAIVANVSKWDDHRRTQLASRWFPMVHQQSEALKASLAAGRPSLSLRPEYADFYTLCLERSPVLRERAERARSGVDR
jgi:hypothetical protein